MNPSASPLQPIQTNNQPTFPKALNQALILPPLIALGSYVANTYLATDGANYLAGIFSILGLLSGIGVLIIYIYQSRYIYRYLSHTRVIRELLFIFIAALVPTIAGFIGDQQGLAEFGSDANTSSMVPAIMIFSATLAGLLMYYSSVANSVYINHRGQLGGLRTIGIIFKVLISLGVGVIAYIAYTLAYSARDPSSE